MKLHLSDNFSSVWYITLRHSLQTMAVLN